MTNFDDLTAKQALARLSTPAGLPGDDRHALSRRRFLQAVGAGVGGAALGGFGHLPGIGDHAAEAASLGDTDGIVILLGMYGGNDGLRMVAPINDVDYARMRQFGVKVTPEEGLSLGSYLGTDFAFAPEMTSIKSMWDEGNVAIVHGVGYENPNLSHFTSMAFWMAGRPNGAPTSGWVGRWLDQSPPDLFRSAVIGHSLPLHMQGVNRRSIAVPEWGIDFGGRQQAQDKRAYKALHKFADQPTARGPWAKALGQSVSDTLDVAKRVNPIFDDPLPEGMSEISNKLLVAARLINADLGFRVLDTGWGNFDNHSDETTVHPEQMTMLDDAIALFYATLDPVWRNRVTIMTFSEFGRTPYDNASVGTDHGTTQPQLVIGHGVNGGHYGVPPTLSTMTNDWDRLVSTIDFRQVYASMLSWLGSDDASIAAVLDTANSAQRTPIPGMLGTPSL